MENINILVKDLLELLCDEEVTYSQLWGVIQNSKVTLVQKQGFIRIMTPFRFDMSREECIKLLKNLDLNSFRRRIAVFEKVSLERFAFDLSGGSLLLGRGISDDSFQELYDGIQYPSRGTRGSAGYDFFMPYDVTLNVGDEVEIFTGIRCCMEEGYVLKIYPRSSLGTKYRLQFLNTTPILDSDYYFSSNEGHILLKLVNENKDGEPLHLSKGSKICQGVFVEYGLTVDDNVKTIRKGGFGSTGK